MLLSLMFALASEVRGPRRIWVFVGRGGAN